MKNSKVILLIGTLVGILSPLASCEDDDTMSANESVALDSGFLVVTSGDMNRFVRYTPDLPGGTFDAAAGESFERFTIRDQFQNQLFLNSVSSQNGVEKFVVTESGQVESAGNIPTSADAFPITIAGQNTGYYSDRNDLTKLFIFDPASMQRTGEIDLSDAFFIEGADFENYGGITIRGNDMFFPYRARRNSAVATDSLIYHVIDLNTDTYVKTIFLPGHIEPRVFNTPAVDEQGNIYQLTTGDQAFPNLIKPSIVKIPAGSTDFDASYDFRPLDALPGGAQLPVQVMDGFFYDSDGIAYAFGTIQIPESVTQIVTEAGGLTQLTQEERNMILSLIATEPASAWLRIDLNAQTVSVIQDIPLSTPFADAITEIDGDLYLGTASNELTAIYRYDPDTQTSTEVFRLSTASGDISGLFDLSKNN